MIRTVRTIGSGSAVASATRSHSATLVTAGDTRLLLDVGDGTAGALARAKEDIRTISAIVISHFHPDHAAGLPGLLQQFRLAELGEPVPLFLPPIAHSRLPAVLSAFGLTPEKCEPVVSPARIEDGPTQLPDSSMQFKALRNSHQGDSTPLGESYSYVIRSGSRRLYLSADIGSASDMECHARECATAVVETTHVHPDRIIEVAHRLGCERLVLTHVGPEWEARAHENTEQASLDVQWACDGATYKW